ncbi:MAG: lipopolysaccharide biosynthesis protein RfbH [Planctomycetes bacterium]|nr:lipopolysaccharide biosynthesis protein RfbH [Planctomycetota bacterium]
MTGHDEEALRAQIREAVARIGRLREREARFVPGETQVHYAGRVFDERELQAAVDAAVDGWLTLGRHSVAFERAFARAMGRRRALLANSGSSANLLATGALCSASLERPLVPGDEVITPALTFPTTLNPILQYGLIPVFVDVEPGTLNLDAHLLEGALSVRTRAVALPHTLGNTADLDVVTAFCQAHGLRLLEDCCDALGTTWGGRAVGTFGDVATTSFYAAHHMTTGEGGMVYTDDAQVFRAAQSLRDWGRDCWCEPGVSNTCGKRFDWELGGLPRGYDHKYIYSHIGYNLKPLDIAGAVGLVQLEKLPRFHAERRANFGRLREALAPHASWLEPARSLSRADPSWFSFPVTVREEAPFGRAELVGFLEARRIETRSVFSGNILRHPAYRAIPHRVVGELRETDRVMERTFFVGVYPGLTPAMLDHMVASFRAFLDRRPR